MVRAQGQLSTPGTSADIYIMFDVDESGTRDDINNRSLMNHNLFLYRNNSVGSPYNLNGNASKSAVIDGTTVNSGGTSYDFRSPRNTAGSTYPLGSGTHYVTHATDGTKSFSFSCSFSDAAGATLGSGGGSNSMAVTRTQRLTKIKDASVWKRGYVWIKDGGVWKRGLIHGKDAGAWKRPSVG
jgi:hypothetical protein